MSATKKTAGKTASSIAASAAKGGVARDIRRRRITSDGSLIYRPAKYPVEVADSVDIFVVQTDCFTDESQYDESSLIATHFVGNDRETTQAPSAANLFDSCEEAMDYAIAHVPFHVGEDGNVYPRVLKVRTSMIVEGVAFEPVLRDIEGVAKLEGVA